jgi:hypothetical protein
MIVVGLEEHRRPRGYRGRPPRSCLVRAKRGNPVWVRAVRSGRLTVRNAQLPGGQRMIKKRTPAAETQRKPRPADQLPPADGRGSTGRIPGQVPGRESELTWSGEPVRNDDEAIFRTDGQVRHDGDPGPRGERTGGRSLWLASGQLAPGRARGTTIAPADLHGVEGGGPCEGPLVAEVDAQLPVKRVGEPVRGWYEELPLKRENPRRSRGSRHRGARI